MRRLINKRQTAIFTRESAMIVRRSFSTNSSRQFTTSKVDFNENVEVTVQEAFKTNLWNISAKPFEEKVANILLERLDENDIEIKPDGILYLPEIKYRRILNRAFGPGGWGMVPKGEHTISRGFVCQQFALFCHGQLVSTAWGEQTYDEDEKNFRALATALEGAKSNALMRCCKDLGIASELWDPSFILQWKTNNVVEVWAKHYKTGLKRKLFRRKDRPQFEYPYVEQQSAGATTTTNTSSSTPSTSYETPMEERDVNMFDNFDMEEKPKSQEVALDLNEPIKFGKFINKTWGEVIDSPDFISYVSWMMKKGRPNAQLKAAYDILKSRGQVE